MRFSYYTRLTRAQQKVYDESDRHPAIALPRPSALHPFVTALEAALRTEERPPTQAATERLIRALTDALGIPPVRVQVLAARPHRGWGELHGLYTAEPGRPAQIQLWMRTAKQRRVVAFRTYLRTLLHEVGHHVDYTYLRLADSYHTEGFYKRESSLFYQLVPEANARTTAGRSFEDYASRPRAERLDRLERMPGELGRVLGGRKRALLEQRPAPDAWSASEVVCHLRDAEEHLAGWGESMLLMETPPLLEPSTAHRWAEERQYARQDVGAAWDAFSRWRDETLERFRGLDSGQWQRAGVHPRRGRMTIDDLLSLIAWHDDDHLDQIRRALDGRP